MKKNKDLLTYYREVLDKISTADARTFRKELRKAFRALLPEERKALKEWYRSLRLPAARGACGGVGPLRTRRVQVTSKCVGVRSAQFMIALRRPRLRPQRCTR
ncbi:MAG: hypothetical protein IPK99_02585 [Flavobacteriales bacterium]|nr:hypothetical protein [Flavobacteriales bacterium]